MEISENSGELNNSMSADDNAVVQILTADLRDPVSWARDIIRVQLDKPASLVPQTNANSHSQIAFQHSPEVCSSNCITEKFFLAESIIFN